MDYTDRRPKSLLKKSLFVSLFLHASLLGSIAFFLRGDSVERAAGLDDSGGGVIHVELIGRDPTTTLASPPTKEPLFETDERKRSGESVGEGGEGGTSQILRQIRNKIERNKFYPLLAKRSRIEGSPLIEFKIRQDGSLEYVTLKQTSGSPLLDEAATTTVQQAVPYPFHPEPITLNIHYSLNQ